MRTPEHVLSLAKRALIRPKSKTAMYYRQAVTGETGIGFVIKLITDYEKAIKVLKRIAKPSMPGFNDEIARAVRAQLFLEEIETNTDNVHSQSSKEKS